ncbi:MAG: hypothetical protein B7733_24645 [Myxococcales bacterium FL481]|nr:MAG: hypothetical protein B7733_24645 [Myxococcales bacterium FL481]
MSWTVRNVLEVIRSRMLERYDSAVNMQKLAAIYAGQLQEIEDAIDYLQGRTLENSEGVWLDRYGALIDRARREDWTEDEYREQIRIVIKARASQGTAEDIIDLARSMRPTGSSGVVSYYLEAPAGYGLSFSVPTLAAEDQDYYVFLLSLATPVGVQGTLVLWQESSPPLIFDTVDPATHGFDVGHFSETLLIHAE